MLEQQLVLFCTMIPNKAQDHIHELFLQCLEAEFYSWAAYGKSLAAVEPALTGNGSFTCCLHPSFYAQTRSVLQVAAT